MQVIVELTENAAGAVNIAIAIQVGPTTHHLNLNLDQMEDLVNELRRADMQARQYTKPTAWTTTFTAKGPVAVTRSMAGQRRGKRA